MIPAVFEYFGGSFRLVPIALHNDVAANRNLADLFVAELAVIVSSTATVMSSRTRPAEASRFSAARH